MSATPVVQVDAVTYAYPESASPVLQDLSFALAAASFTLVVGRSGSGKSTMLRLLNGLVPHFSGGRFSGNVHVGGRNTRQHGPRELASTVGFVFQDPEAQMLTDRVEDEIAFGMEQAGVAPATMRKRVEEALDLLRIGHLRERSPATLSGGERQRVAIASAMVMHPQVLVLDEPTSQLDPWSADDVLTVIQRLNEDLGTAVLMAEHRLERTLPIADQLMLMDSERGMTLGATREMVAHLDAAALPPVARLGGALGWQPTPLTVKEGRRWVDATYPVIRRMPESNDSPSSDGSGREATYPIRELFRRNGRRSEKRGESQKAVSLEVDRVTVRRGGRDVLRDCSLDIAPGELIALMGRNGSGKTSLLRVIAGLDQPVSGRVALAGGHRKGAIGYVPQQPAALLWHESIRADIRFAMQAAQQQGGDVGMDEFLEQLGILALADRHPRDLSVGERVRAAIAVALAGDPSILLLDEPTRGMDWEAKATLMTLSGRLCAQGVPVVFATHDVELMANWADRVVLLGDREVVAVGSPREVLTNSLTFSTQMNTLLGGSILTVDGAIRSLRDQARPET